MSNYVVKKLTQDDIPNYLNVGMTSYPCVLYGIHDKSFAWICKEEKCDYEYIVDNNINHIKLNAPGSTIVCSKGDVDFGFFGTETFCKEMFAKLSKVISELISDGVFINNDFMYNGNKHGSATFIDFGECYYIGVHISNNINKDLISRVCKKKSFKTPEKMPIQLTEETILKVFNGEYYEIN